MQEQKSRVLLIVIALASLLVIPQSGFLCQASVDYWNTPAFKEEKFEKVYGYDNIGEVAWSINVKAIIPTEKNGEWILNKTYEVSWEITLDYINQTYYPNNGFFIGFCNFSNPFYNAIAYNPNADIADFSWDGCEPSNAGAFGLKETGYICVFYLDLTPQSLGNYTFVSAFSIKVFNNDNLESTINWTQNKSYNPPIWINVESPQPSPLPSASANRGIITLRHQDQLNQILSALPIVMIVIAVASTLITLVKRAKAYDESKKANTNTTLILDDNQNSERKAILDDASVSKEDIEEGILLRCRNAWVSDTQFYYCRTFWKIAEMIEASVDKKGVLSIRFIDGKTRKFRLAPNEAEMREAKWSNESVILRTLWSLNKDIKKRSPQWATTINNLIAKQKHRPQM